MHKTKRTNKHFKKTRKVRKKLPKKSKNNYCKKYMTDEAIRIYNLLKKDKADYFKKNKNKKLNENETQNENKTQNENETKNENKNQTNDQ